MRQLKVTPSITNRSEKSLDRYLVEIGKIELVSTEEEARLAGRIRSGDKNALEILVRANLRFVISVAKNYQYRGLPLNDLINEGNFGLIKAAQHFDETKGFKFISYAVWWIRQSMMEAIARTGSTVRLPINQLSRSASIQRTASIMEQEMERTPSSFEIAEQLGIQETEVSFLKTFSSRAQSLDALPFEDAEDTLANTLASDEADTADRHLNHHQSLSIELERCLKNLPDKEREILRLFYGIGLEQKLSLGEIGTQLNISPERVRQIKKQAVNRLRVANKSNLLRPFLG